MVVQGDRVAFPFPAGVTPVPGVNTFIYVPLPDPEALCLDGSRYGIFVCLGAPTATQWQIGIQGGGWC